MTKNKAIEILNEMYGEIILCRKILCDNPDDVDYLNDLLIALLTAIDALESAT